MEGSKFSRASVPEARPVSKTAPPGPSKLVTVTSAGDAKVRSSAKEPDPASHCAYLDHRVCVHICVLAQAPAETVIDGCLYKVSSIGNVTSAAHEPRCREKHNGFVVGPTDKGLSNTLCPGPCRLPATPVWSYGAASSSQNTSSTRITSGTQTSTRKRRGTWTVGAS